MKTLQERGTLELLTLTFELNGRAMLFPENKQMHNNYVEARNELELRLQESERVNAELKELKSRLLSISINELPEKDRDYARLQELFDKLNKSCHDKVLEIADLQNKLSSVEQALETEAISMLEWLTSKDSKYAIMYGGTSELEKDYRFATTDKDFTIKEIIDIYKTHDKTI